MYIWNTSKEKILNSKVVDAAENCFEQISLLFDADASQQRLVLNILIRFYALHEHTVMYTQKVFFFCINI